MDRVSRVNLFFFSCLSLVINLALITMSLITAMGLGLNHIPRSHARGTVSIYLLFIYLFYNACKSSCYLPYYFFKKKN